MRFEGTAALIVSQFSVLFVLISFLLHCSHLASGTISSSAPLVDDLLIEQIFCGTVFSHSTKSFRNVVGEAGNDAIFFIRFTQKTWVQIRSSDSAANSFVKIFASDGFSTDSSTEYCYCNVESCRGHLSPNCFLPIGDYFIVIDSALPGGFEYVLEITCHGIFKFVIYVKSLGVFHGMTRTNVHW